LRSLTFMIGQLVKWSDFQPFTSRDVLFTFNLAMMYPALRLLSEPLLFVLGGMVTSVDVTYSNKLPMHFKTSKITSFWPLVMNSPTMLQINTTKYPLSLPAFRKALSMALNRLAIALAVAGGIEPPADSTGLTDATDKHGPYVSWRDPRIPNTLAQYNPAAARA